MINLQNKTEQEQTQVAEPTTAQTPKENFSLAECRQGYWRQLVAIRNYVQMAARTHLSNTEVKNKITKEMKQMLEQIGITWEDYTVDCQRGACAIREQRDGDVRPHWYVDKNIPIFKGKDRDYVNRFVFIE